MVALVVRHHRHARKNSGREAAAARVQQQLVVEVEASTVVKRYAEVEASTAVVKICMCR